MCDVRLSLDRDDERVLTELQGELGLGADEILRRSLRLLGITYALHSSVHGVMSPVGDPRVGA